MLFIKITFAKLVRIHLCLKTLTNQALAWFLFDTTMLGHQQCAHIPEKQELNISKLHATLEAVACKMSNMEFFKTLPEK